MINLSLRENWLSPCIKLLLQFAIILSSKDKKPSLKEPKKNQKSQKKWLTLFLCYSKSYHLHFTTLVHDQAIQRSHLRLLPPPLQSNFEISSLIQNLINSLCPSFSLHRTYFSLKDFPSPSSPSPSCNIFNNPFSLEELRVFINNLKIRSSPGIDRIDYQLISFLPP